MNILKNIINVVWYNWLPYFLKFVHDVVKKVFFVKFFSFIWKILPWKADFTFCGISTAYLVAHFTCSKPVLLKALYAMCFVFLGYIDNCEVNSYRIENSQEALNDEINDKTSGPENKTVSTHVTEKKNEYLPKLPLLVLLHVINFLYTSNF